MWAKASGRERGGCRGLVLLAFSNTVCRTFHGFILMKIKLHGNIGADSARISVQFVVVHGKKLLLSEICFMTTQNISINEIVFAFATMEKCTADPNIFVYSCQQ